MPPRKPSRSEARAERANLKKAAEEADKVRLLARVNELGASSPRVMASVGSGQTPRVGVNISDIFKLRMTWCISERDVVGTWSWGQHRNWSDYEYESHIARTLNPLTGNTWEEIHYMYADGRHRHHEQEVSSIIEEAQTRWAELGIETDMAFRFRLTGRQRAWGFRVGSHFRMVWYDPGHKIYPTEKSHT